MSYVLVCPAAPRVRDAVRLFGAFHRYPADKLHAQRYRRLMPRLLVGLGRLKGLIYSSDRGQPGRPRTFIHFMEAQPLLACDRQGRQLYILGGDYRVTHRGIEG